MNQFYGALSSRVSKGVIPEVRNVSGTAFVVAEFRAEENDAAFPLYQDSIVELFLNEDTKHAAGRVAARFPPASNMVKIRTKYLDDTLDKQIAAGFRQVVILGAGLDTRAVRKPEIGVTYFEIDEGTTLKLKQNRYEQHGIPADVRFIPGNYVTEGFIDLLRRNNFDFDLPTYLIWEGNTMYLPLEAAKSVMTQIRSHIKKFRLSFDYMSDAVISKTTGDEGITALVESFESMDAPWLSGIRDIEVLAKDLNLKVIENFRMADLHLTYWPGRPLASPIFHFYSLCTVESYASH